MLQSCISELLGLVDCPHCLWIAAGASFSLAAALWFGVRFAPFHDDLPMAQRLALAELRRTGHADEISINADGSLRKISLRLDTAEFLQKYRDSAKAYVEFIDALNRNINRLILWRALVFSAASWALVSIYAVSMLLLAQGGTGDWESVLDYLLRTNANALPAVAGLPVRELDPVPGSNLDAVATWPYTLFINYLVPGLFMFVLKFSFLRPKYQPTKKTLRRQIDLDDAALRIELEATRGDGGGRTDGPWFKSWSRLIGVASAIDPHR